MANTRVTNGVVVLAFITCFLTPRGSCLAEEDVLRPIESGGEDLLTVNGSVVLPSVEEVPRKFGESLPNSTTNVSTETNAVQPEALLPRNVSSSSVPKKIGVQGRAVQA